MIFSKISSPLLKQITVSIYGRFNIPADITAEYKHIFANNNNDHILDIPALV